MFEILSNYHSQLREGRLRLNPNLYIDNIPKQLNFEFDQYINKTSYLEKKC